MATATVKTFLPVPDEDTETTPANTLTEAQVVAGSYQIEIELTDDTWIATGSPYATAYTDDFTGDGVLGSPNWTQQGSTATVTKVSGTARCSTTDPVVCSAFWSGETFNANQYAKAVVKATDTLGNGSVGVTVRAKDTGDTTADYYRFETDGTAATNRTNISKLVNNSWTLLLDVATTFSVNDVIELRVTWNGSTNTLSAYKGEDLLGSVEDNALPGTTPGCPGVALYNYNDTTEAQLDDFQCGDLA